ncbi:hypothetical protein [Nitrincola sp.]|uniref:hypothetical protein n=1 Tax=Nitrincola sp. TaxID=1926584 RepID=UPI003A956D87
MTDQVFNGSVGQVAAGDIHNHGRGGFGDMDVDQLKQQRKHFKALLRQAQARVIFNIPNACFLLGMLGLIYLALEMMGTLLSGNFGSTDTQPAAWLFFGGIIAVVGLPLYFVTKTR